jgi:histidinol-phosphatase (PHP family)
MIERIDCHTHTVYSGHGVGTVEEVVSAAEAAGLATLALTEHFILPPEIDPGNDFSMSLEELHLYRVDIERARERHGGLEILCGIEVDWIGQPEQNRLDALEGFEYILGSVHFIDGWAFDDPDQLSTWDDRDVDEVWRRYFEIWCEAAQSAYPFNCMSHPDLPKKFGHRPSFDTRELYEHVAQVAARAGVIVEVNTSGLRRPLHELFPGDALLRAFRAAGVPCTIGSDAHAPQDVGSGFDEACAAMVRAGYAQLCIPLRDGDHRFVDLEGFL